MRSKPPTSGPPHRRQRTVAYLQAVLNVQVPLMIRRLATAAYKTADLSYRCKKRLSSYKTTSFGFYEEVPEYRKRFRQIFTVEPSTTESFATDVLCRFKLEYYRSHTSLEIRAQQGSRSAKGNQERKAPKQGPLEIEMREVRPLCMFMSYTLCVQIEYVN